MIEELKDDMQSVAIESSQIFTAVGSGGTYAGILAGLTAYQAAASHRAVGTLVSDNVGYFRDKIHSDLSSWADQFECNESFQEPILDDRFIGQGYGKAGPAIYELIRKIAKQEGLFLTRSILPKRSKGCWLELRKVPFQKITPSSSIPAVSLA